MSSSSRLAAAILVQIQQVDAQGSAEAPHGQRAIVRGLVSLAPTNPQEHRSLLDRHHRLRQGGRIDSLFGWPATSRGHQAASLAGPRWMAARTSPRCNSWRSQALATSVFRKPIRKNRSLYREKGFDRFSQPSNGAADENRSAKPIKPIKRDRFLMRRAPREPAGLGHPWMDCCSGRTRGAGSGSAESPARPYRFAPPVLACSFDLRALGR